MEDFLWFVFGVFCGWCAVAVFAACVVSGRYDEEQDNSRGGF